MTETLGATAVLEGAGMTGTLLLLALLAEGVSTGVSTGVSLAVGAAEELVTASAPEGVEVERAGQLVTLGAQEVMVTSWVS
jgi:hypothetical protein